MIPVRIRIPSTSALLPGLFAWTALLAGCADGTPLAPDASNPEEIRAASSAHPGGGPGVVTETADVHAQGTGTEGPVVAPGAATVRRTANGISVQLSMPTPPPGSYAYPPGTEPGPPEAFTLWVFVFDDPKAAAWSGAFLGGGHVVGGRHLTLGGHVSRETDPFVGARLENPSGAKVILRFAPHGALDPDALPDQIKTPSGSPAFWWTAEFG
jgi:hypothetical protein